MGLSSESGALDRLLTDAVRDTGAYGAALYLLDPTGRLLLMTAITGLPADVAEPWHRVDLDMPSILADTVRLERLHWRNAPLEEAEGRQAALTSLPMPYAYATAHVPLACGDSPCSGALVVLWPPSHAALTPGEHAALSRIADRMGTVLRRAADAGTPETAGDRPREVPLPRDRTPDPALTLAAADFAERLPEGALALRLDGSTSWASATAADLLGTTVRDLLDARPWDVLPWLCTPACTDRYRAALLTREPTSFTAVRPPDHRLRFQFYPGAHGLSVRVTPTSEPVHGPPASGSPLTQDGTLQRVTQVAVALTQAIGVRDIVDISAGHILPAFDAQGLVLYVTEGDRLHVAGHRGYSEEVMAHFDGATLGTRANAAARAMEENRPGFYGSPREMSALFPGIPELTGKAAWAFLPLVTSGHAVGCFVLSYDRPHTFTRDERTILTSLAGLLAQALDRARLFDAKQQLARQLQAGLLPHALPDLPGLCLAARYLPATRGMEIGGDFYDVLPLDAYGRVAAVIGDVQGHNVTAAALMGQVRTAVHASTDRPPQDVLARTNRLLTDLDPGLFTSCCYLTLDPAAERATLATAGHPPPLIRLPDGRITVPDLPPGPLLGIDADARYPAVGLPLPSGSVLLLYTDGLVERPGLDPDAATAGLARDLAAAADHTFGSGGTMDDLADHLLRVRHTENREDDIALLLLNPCAPRSPHHRNH